MMSIPSKAPAVNDVIGPAVATDLGIAKFNGTSGRKLSSSTVKIDSNDNLEAPGFVDLKNQVAAPASPAAGFRRLYVDPRELCLLVKDSAGRLWGIEYNPLYVCEEMDDFIFASTETGEAGNRGWSFTNGSLTSNVGVSNHPGILLRTSGTTISQVASFYPGSAGNIGRVLMEQFDMIRWIIRAPATNTDHIVRIGICLDSTANPSTNGVYFERLAADTNWFRVVRNGATQTRQDTGIAYDTSWINLMIRRAANGTSMEFWINNALNGTISDANIPAGGTGMLQFLQIIPTTTTARTIEVDLFHFKSMPVTR